MLGKRTASRTSLCGEARRIESIHIDDDGEPNDQTASAQKSRFSAVSFRTRARADGTNADETQIRGTSKSAPDQMLRWRYRWDLNSSHLPSTACKGRPSASFSGMLGYLGLRRFIRLGSRFGQTVGSVRL
jgi:hypothetical protein